MPLSVYDSFDLESSNTELLKDIKEKIYEFAQSEIENSTAHKKIMFAEDLCKLRKKEQKVFHDKYHYVLIECSNTNVNVNVKSHGSDTYGFIYELMHEMQRLMADASYPLQKELIESEISVSMEGGECDLYIDFAKEKGNKLFSYEEFVMQNVPLCDALKACGAFELNVGEEWVGMEENFFAIVRKIAEKNYDNYIDMLLIMAQSHDEIYEGNHPVLVKVRYNINEKLYEIIGYLNQSINFTKQGECLDMDSYPLCDIMDEFFWTEEMDTERVESVLEVDKRSNDNITRNIVLGCELKQKMLVKSFL
jgi:hypothetical protein